MKKFFVVLFVLFSLLGVYSIAEATGKLVIKRVTSDGYVTTQPSRLISAVYIANSIGELDVADGTPTTANRKFKLEHVVAQFGPYDQAVAPVFLNGIYADFLGITPASATFVYIELE